MKNWWYKCHKTCCQPTWLYIATRERQYCGCLHTKYLLQYIYTGCPRRNGQNFGRVFLVLNYTDITQNTYIQSWTITEIMAIEKCGLLGCPCTVSRPWRHTHPLRMPGNEKPLANIGMQWPWRDNEQLWPAYITWKPKDNYNSSASVFSSI